MLQLNCKFNFTLKNVFDNAIVSLCYIIPSPPLSPLPSLSSKEKKICGKKISSGIITFF